MVNIDRRSAIALGLGGAALPGATLAAQAIGEPSAAAAPLSERFSLNVLEAAPAAAQPDAVLFWHDVGLQLVALDHSLAPGQARAPGPCATARALGVANAVVADAVAVVFPAPYKPLFGPKEPVTTAFPHAFVGAVAAWILEHIFDTPAHTQHIGAQRLTFLSRFQRPALDSWRQGLAYAEDAGFARCWDGDGVRAAVLKSPTPYVPGPGQHAADPYHADQGFYGVEWGAYPPLTPGLGDPVGLEPPAPPPPADPEYRRDLAEVREKGVYKEAGPTPDQERVGLFWAYDGARLIGTPPRLYNQIVREIAVAYGMTTVEMARLFALCNLAMADAGIVAWAAKYRHKVWRPVLGIQNDRESPDPGWRPFGAPSTNHPDFALGTATRGAVTAQNLLGAGGLALPGELGDALAALCSTASSEHPTAPPTPPAQDAAYRRGTFTPNFPAYPSGHATFGSACFNALRTVRAGRTATAADPDKLELRDPFVSDEVNGLSIDHLTGEPRDYLPVRYTSIQKMIDDNNDSRVHLGVHWRFDSDRGSKSGVDIAERVVKVAYAAGT